MPVEGSRTNVGSLVRTSFTNRVIAEGGSLILAGRRVRYPPTREASSRVSTRVGQGTREDVTRPATAGGTQAGPWRPAFPQSSGPRGPHCPPIRSIEVQVRGSIRAGGNGSSGHQTGPPRILRGIHRLAVPTGSGSLWVTRARNPAGTSGNQRNSAELSGTQIRSSVFSMYSVSHWISSYIYIYIHTFLVYLHMYICIYI